MTVFPHAQPPQRRRSGAMARVKIHGRHENQDMSEFHMERRSCALHQVTYLIPQDAEKLCPVCMLEDRVKELKDQLLRTSNELQLAMQNSERLSTAVNELDAMRKALTLISGEDLTFVKSIAYRFKSDETAFQLIACRDADDRWQFLVRVKKAGGGRIGEEHICRSFGGIALASAFEQANKVSGNMKATQMLVRAVSQHLATLENS